MQNKNISIVDFAPEHIALLRLRKEDAADFAGIDMDALMNEWRGGRTVLVKGRPAFVYGFTEHAGTVELWAITGREMADIPLFVTRLGRELIRGFFRVGAHRVEAACHADNARSLRWLTRSLGFDIEGLMRCCGPNRQDRFLLAIINPEARRGH